MTNFDLRDKRTGYFWGQTDILCDEKLGHCEKMTYVVLCSFSGMLEGLSHEKIAKRAGLSVRAVIRSLASLEKEGYIAYHSKAKGLKNCYVINDRQPVTASHTPCDSESHLPVTASHSTTSIDNSIANSSEDSSMGEEWSKNRKRILELKEAKEFDSKKYDFPVNGKYDWRYLVNHGDRLTPPKLMCAHYWRLKEKYSRMGISYQFSSGGAAWGQFESEQEYAKKLAKMITYSQLERLCDIVEEKFEKFGSGNSEWKLKSLCDNVYRLNENE